MSTKQPGGRAGGAGDEGVGGAGASPARVSRRALGAWALGSLAGCEGAGSRTPRSGADAARPPALSGGGARGQGAAVERPARRPLWQRFPDLEAKIPSVRLADAPTPLVPAAALGERLGVPKLYVKRDDVAAAPYGGSKIRKLEFLLAEAKAAGADSVVTTGGVGSHHAVATACHAPRVGLRAVLLLLPEPATEHVRENLLLDARFGADLRLARGRDEAARETAALVRRGAFAIAAGGSSPRGNLGFVDAAFELERQVEAGLLPEPDVVYLGMGTMGAAVGLAIGLAASRLRTRVVAVRASNPDTSSEARLAAAVAATTDALVGLRGGFPAVRVGPERLAVDGAQLGRGYALPTNAGRAALELARRHGGLDLELTYTAKTLAALAAAAPRHRDETVLFWHTHSARPVAAVETDPIDLPRAFRPYVAR
jgi:1-aminocyclopropane-1-carboxylate deaminase/D-cysteine desulfhydrase-like pyridoxal-dependent ACC family enzyme